jgi:predicted ATP-dependent serine protease
MSDKFKRQKEDFICQKCGYEVEGNGYTNHCPQCLWSQHVDVFPGDRAAAQTCGGMMEPIRVEKNGKEYTIIHKCQRCDIERPNKAVKEDNFEMLVQISVENSKKF